MSQVTGTNFALGSYEKFQPGFRDEKKAKNPGDEFWCETRETEQTWQNTKIITFAPIIALATLLSCITAVKLGCLWRGKYRGQCKTTPSGPPKSFLAKVSARLPRSRLEKPRSPAPEPARPLVWTHRKFYNGFRGKARSRKPGLCGEALNYVLYWIKLGYKDLKFCLARDARRY